MNTELSFEDDQFGDPRLCPTHGTVISSPDGQFDGCCPQCESADDQYAEDEAARLLGWPEWGEIG